MITAKSDKYKGLRVSFVGGSIKFVDGVAAVDEAQAERLLALPESYGVKVEDYDPAKGSGDEPFDPSKHNADEVHAYLASIDDSDPDAHDAEVVRVLNAEKAGKNRKGIVESIEGNPDR